MQFSTRARILVVAGLVLTGLSTVVGLKSLGHIDKPAAAPGVRVTAVPGVALAGAVRAINVGETITPALVRTAAGDAARNANTATPAEVIGKVATHFIPAGALIQRAMVGAQGDLALRVPVGLRAVSIDTTAEMAVAGLLQPGDQVDVQAIYPGGNALGNGRGTAPGHTQTLLQMVTVLAVGDQVVGAAGQNHGPATPPNASQTARTVTLALSPEQVAALSVARSSGTLYLSLRNPEDKDLPAARIAPLPEARPPATRLASTRRAPRRAGGEAPVQIVIGGQSNAAPSGER